MKIWAPTTTVLRKFSLLENTSSGTQILLVAGLAPTALEISVVEDTVDVLRRFRHAKASRRLSGATAPASACWMPESERCEARLRGGHVHGDVVARDRAALPRRVLRRHRAEDLVAALVVVLAVEEQHDHRPLGGRVVEHENLGRGQV